MTQQILFLIVVLIGAYYARKYGNKAKRDIEKYYQNKEQDKIKKPTAQISNPCPQSKKPSHLKPLVGWFLIGYM